MVAGIFFNFLLLYGILLFFFAIIAKSFFLINFKQYEKCKAIAARARGTERKERVPQTNL